MKLIHMNDILSIPGIINVTFRLPVRSFMIIALHHLGVARTRSIEKFTLGRKKKKKKKKKENDRNCAKITG